jgi:hypothetical protein
MRQKLLSAARSGLCRTAGLAALGERRRADERANFSVGHCVVNRIRRLLSEPVSLFEMVKVHAGKPLLQQSLMAHAAELAEEWARLSPLRMRVVLVALV